MLEMLDARFDSENVASNISKMLEFVSVCYTNLCIDIAKHFDRMDALFEQLFSMQASMETP